MTACLIPFSLKKITSRDSLRYRIIPKISICCDIDKNKLSDIIQSSFTQKGDLSVFGYNTHYDEFWAKKIIKDEFLLHFTLTVKSIGYENSNIIITPIVGNDKEIKNLLSHIKETIYLYKCSNLINEKLE
jgi:hypothetical protein